MRTVAVLTALTGSKVASAGKIKSSCDVSYEPNQAGRTSSAVLVSLLRQTGSVSLRLQLDLVRAASKRTKVDNALVEADLDDTLLGLGVDPLGTFGAAERAAGGNGKRGRHVWWW